MTRIDLLSAIFLIVPATAHAVCHKPTPKVCSEFFKSDTVVIGKVIAQQEVAASDNLDDGWGHRIRVHQTYRGRKRGELLVFTENNSGRLPLAVDHEYLLFADRIGNRLEVTNCGNSGLATERAVEIHTIEKLATGASRIEGHVAARPTWAVVQGARFNIVGAAANYFAMSDESGLFSVEVAPGSYVVSPESAGVDAFDLSYDDPKRVYVQRGQCAQVQFVTDRNGTADLP